MRVQDRAIGLAGRMTGCGVLSRDGLFESDHYLPLDVTGASLKFSSLVVCRCAGSQQTLDIVAA